MSHESREMNQADNCTHYPPCYQYEGADLSSSQCNSNPIPIHGGHQYRKSKSSLDMKFSPIYFNSSVPDNNSYDPNIHSSFVSAIKK